VTGLKNFGMSVMRLRIRTQSEGDTSQGNSDAEKAFLEYDHFPVPSGTKIGVGGDLTQTARMVDSGKEERSKIQKGLQISLAKCSGGRRVYQASTSSSILKFLGCFGQLEELKAFEISTSQDSSTKDMSVCFLSFSLHSIQRHTKGTKNGTHGGICITKGTHAVS